jgi:hypothetical protein
MIQRIEYNLHYIQIYNFMDSIKMKRTKFKHCVTQMAIQYRDHVNIAKYELQ